MRRQVGWLIVLFLCCAAGEDAGVAPPDPRLAEASASLGEAKKLLHQRALAIREETLGPHHPDLAITITNLANLYTEQGLYGRAEPLYLRALAVKEKALGPHHPSFAHSLNNLALLYQAQGQYARARPVFQRALAIFEAAFGKHHALVANALINLANAYRGQGKVNDDSTRLLMEHFYQNLLAGQGRASALRSAMLAVRQELPHPYSWAPFISLGSDAPLRSLASKPSRKQ